MKFRSAFQLTLSLLCLLTIETAAAELPSVILTSSGNAVRLNYWQILKDTQPRNPPLSYPDSLWRSFQPALDDERYTGGNWLIRSSVDIKDSLSSKEIFGIFPVNLVTAYEIYWDGIKIGENGITGTSISNERAGNFNYSLVLPPDILTSGKHTIIIRLSNFDNLSSWKWFYGDIIIGKYDYLSNRLSSLNYQAFFITGVVFIPFLFNLFLYFSRNRKTEHLLFSLICFIVILDSTTTLVPALFHTKTTFVYWQYYSYNFVTLLFTILLPAFFIYLFSFSKKIIGLVAAANLLIFFFFTDYSNAFKIMPLTVLIISSVISILALYKRREESLIIFTGIIAGWAAYFFNFAFAGLAAVMVICTSFSIARQFARKETAEKEAQLKSANLENELLKKNINPHFVLNTLTSVIVWLRKDTISAIKLIEALAEEFRMINQISSLKQIPIGQEIDLCRAHLKIMSYRKGADFKIETLNIDEHDTVPPMIFHTLVENGLTHGYEKKTSGIFNLQTIKNSDSVKYILKNDGDFDSDDPKGSTGFGAKYVQGRLEESYPGKWNFSSNKAETGWESIIEIRN